MPLTKISKQKLVIKMMEVCAIYTEDTFKNPHQSEIGWDEVKTVADEIIRRSTTGGPNMNETEKDTSHQCNHNYEYIKTFATKSGGEFVKIYKCTKCGKGCEKRTNRMGSRPRNPIIV